MSLKQFVDNQLAEAAPKTIISFLVVVLIFCGVFGTIAMELGDVGDNVFVSGGKYNPDYMNATEDAAGTSTSDGIPGGAIMISIVGLLGIIILVMWAIKRAF